MTRLRRLFSERQIVIRSKGRIRYLTLSRSAMIVGVCAAIGGTAALGRVVASTIIADRKMAHKEAEVVQAELSNDDLRKLVVQLQQRLSERDAVAEEMRGRLAAASLQSAGLRSELYGTELRLRALDQTRGELLAQREETLNRLHGAEDGIAAKSGQIARLSSSLDGARSDLKQSEQQRSELGGRVRELEAALQDAKNQVLQLRTSWEAAERKVQQATADRETLVVERDGLLGRLAAQQQPVPAKGRLARTAAAVDAIAAKLSGEALAPAQPERVEPVAPAEPQLRLPELAPAREPPPPAVQRESRGGWEGVRELLASAGVDVDELAGRLGAVPMGRGGPFVPLAGLKGKHVTDGSMPENLRKVLSTLPLTAPLPGYQLESKFGPRIDPFNHRESFHSGLDLSAQFKSPVYATAPGVVLSAGPKGDYGKMVEIDHGSGIVTRYAHLHRITVAVGQHLHGHEQIGLLGSTGRSSGPHVHYEVVVNGTAQDPEKFLEAGKSVVQVSQKQ